MIFDNVKKYILYNFLMLIFLFYILILLELLGFLFFHFVCMQTTISIFMINTREDGRESKFRGKKEDYYDTFSLFYLRDEAQKKVLKSNIMLP